MTKTKSFRTLAALALALAAFGLAPAAQAEVSFHGTFAGPHGVVSIGIGHPRYAVGSFVPYGHRVFERPRYGHGFWSPSFDCRAHHVRHTHWVPVNRYRNRWVVVERPVYVQPYYAQHPLERAWGGPAYGDVRYDNDRDDRYNKRRDDRYDKRRHDNRRWRHQKHSHNKHCRH